MMALYQVKNNLFGERYNLAVEMNGNHQAVRRYITGVGKDDFEGYFECSEVWNPFNTDKTGWYSYVKDQVGTVYKVVSLGNQQVIDNRTYDSFGNLVNQSGSSQGSLGFQSKYYNSETRLYYFYNRYYNPANGRFINEDPIGFNGGLNFYQFVLNDPISLIDPFGTQFDPGKYYNGKYHTLRPGTEDSTYNCMGYAVGSNNMQPPEGKYDPAVNKPNLIPPRFGCSKTNCNKSNCNDCEHLIAVYEDKSNLQNWHVYRQDNGNWSCKFGENRGRWVQKCKFCSKR
ncbi:MAG: RHS repeat-associated core domain-containing protein [Candidatus Aminicenantes bacterium]|nr:RHS repeat-associated core domain-containing protein [Candidatus Aminicenantes bacterium]